jgi:hypothetical protein
MQYEGWRLGMPVQNAFPEMSAGNREFLISRTCETCFDKMVEEKEA